MADVSSPQDRNSKFNVELNLVPFIDLLSVLVLFLLATSVFESLRSFQLPLEKKSSVESTTQASGSSPLPKFIVSVKKDHITLSWNEESITQPIALETKDLGNRLKDILKNSKIENASVESVQGIAYGQVIAVMDELKSVGIHKIALLLKE